ncbi:PAS domain S-box protein [Flavisolibacter nicotianae]|uniref:PAS domain S-box protein n=1 Tax=Flavisolibacter nicotianae TaxID=2364882 RepID=UPI0013C4A956|nr:PAS domain S-box protein [Flavisolibacter nicotianae]
MKGKLVGKSFFSHFFNDSDPLVAARNTMRASFERVVQDKQPHRIAKQQYVFPTGDGLFRETSCSVENVPVLNDAGEVRYIIHTIEEGSSKNTIPAQDNPVKDIARAHSLFMQAPVAVCIVNGPSYIVELVNEQMLQFLGRTPAMIGKPIVESLPEAKVQGLLAILEKVRSSGKGYHAPNFAASLIINGVREKRYFDLVFEPYFRQSNDTVPDSVFCVAYNVTRQIEIQQRLEEVQIETDKQKRLYEAITASTPDLIYVFDLSYRFVYANEALLNMWGKEWNEAIGKGLLENGYEPWHAEMHEREIDLVVANKQPVRGEVSFPHATLGSRVYDYIFVPVFNKEGEVEAVAGTTRDITEIKQAEQTIREREESFRNLADDSPMFVFIIAPDPLAPVSYWNKTWLHYTGQSAEQAAGTAWDNIIHPDDVPVVMAYYTAAFENRQPYFIPSVRVKRYDHAYRWHAFKGNPRYLPNGEFNGYVGVGFDVHEQKLAQDALIQNEERTRLAVESTHMGTFEVDVAKQFILHSPRTAEIMGLDPSRQWSYQTIVETVHPEDKVIREAAHGEARKSGKLFYEARIIYPDSSIHWVRLNGTMIDFLGSPTLVGTIMDITEEKKAAELLEQKIEERTRELKQVNDQLKQFSYAASHDLQEPLRKISYFVERLVVNLGQTLSEENRMITERIQLTTGRMRTLIDDLLEYSNTTLGTAVFEEVNLAAIVHSVLDDMEATLLDKKANVNVQPLSTVNGDHRQLRQLFQNLISNALKYHKKGEAPQLQILSRFVQGKEIESGIPEAIPDKMFYQIEVKDNGIGFDPDDAERIFRIFQRLHGKAEFEGTGVGLAIVEKVVKNHDGYIWAVSSPGAGATFNILLPAEQYRVKHNGSD